jgi:hypothetical protein
MAPQSSQISHWRIAAAAPAATHRGVDGPLPRPCRSGGGGILDMLVPWDRLGTGEQEHSLAPWRGSSFLSRDGGWATGVGCIVRALYRDRRAQKARQRARSCFQPASQLPATGPQGHSTIARARAKNTLENHDRTWVPSTPTVLGNVVWCCPLCLTGPWELRVAPTPKWAIHYCTHPKAAAIV